MMRLLVLLALAIIAYTVLRRVLTSPAVRRSDETPHYTPMVTCVTCGVHLPESTAIRSSGRYYCSPDHAGLPQP